MMSDPIVPLNHPDFPPPFLSDEPRIGPFPWWKLPPELYRDLEKSLTRAPEASDLSDADRMTLRSLAQNIRNLRRDFKANKDRPATTRRLIATLSYASGFCEARGVDKASSVLTQVAAAQAQNPEFDVILSEIESGLLQMSDPTRTGLLTTPGLGHIAIGIALKVLADSL